MLRPILILDLKRKLYRTVKMGEQLNVNWETHSDHIKELFGKLKTTGCFSDVTLVCDDKVRVGHGFFDFKSFPKTVLGREIFFSH